MYLARLPLARFEGARECSKGGNSQDRLNPPPACRQNGISGGVGESPVGELGDLFPQQQSKLPTLVPLGGLNARTCSSLVFSTICPRLLSPLKEPLGLTVGLAPAGIR